MFQGVFKSFKFVVKTGTAFSGARYSATRLHTSDYKQRIDRKGVHMMSATGMDAIQGLEPRTVWELFGKLSSIPRPSFHEERYVSENI